MVLVVFCLFFRWLKCKENYQVPSIILHFKPSFWSLHPINSFFDCYRYEPNTFLLQNFPPCPRDDKNIHANSIITHYARNKYAINREVFRMNILMLQLRKVFRANNIPFYIYFSTFFLSLFNMFEAIR